MLHPSISRKNIVLNGIYPNEFAAANGQTVPTAFRVDQGDVLSLGYSESFAVAATFADVAPYNFKSKINDVALAAVSLVSQTTGNVTVTDGGVLAYNGAGNTSVVIGGDTGKPFVAPFVFSVLDLAVLATKVNNFTLTLGPGREIYNFAVQSDNSVKLYVRNGAAWDVVNTFPIGHAIIATDTVSYRVSNEKIELLINNVMVWEKLRTWTVLLSSADLGVLETAPPYTFGQPVKLTLGNKNGDYILSFHDQEGVALKIDQPIQVSTDAAVTMNASASNDILIPVLAATVLANTSAATAPVTTNSIDWGKILTWGGIALAGIVVVAGLMWAIRGKN